MAYRTFQDIPIIELAKQLKKTQWRTQCRNITKEGSFGNRDKDTENKRVVQISAQIWQ